MSIYDEAQAKDLLHQEQSLKAHRAKYKNTAAQLIIAGDVCCRDCEDPIEKERLKAKPDASKCITCQIIQEAGDR